MNNFLVAITMIIGIISIASIFISKITTYLERLFLFRKTFNERSVYEELHTLNKMLKEKKKQEYLQQYIEKSTMKLLEQRTRFKDIEELKKHLEQQIEQENKLKEYIKQRANKIIKIYRINKQEKKQKESSVIDDLLYKKRKKYKHAIKLVFVTALIYCITNIIFNNNIRIEVIIFLDIFAVLIIISQLLINYRIKKGYFGTNYTEAKEVLYFLKVNNNKNNKTGKKILNEIYNTNKIPQSTLAEKGNLQY